MSSKNTKKPNSKPIVSEKDIIIANNNFYIKKLEQNLANQAITITRLETNIDILKGQK